jgi:hypothetical protein
VRQPPASQPGPALERIRAVQVQVQPCSRRSVTASRRWSWSSPYACTDGIRQSFVRLPRPPAACMQAQINDDKRGSRVDKEEQEEQHLIGSTGLHCSLFSSSNEQSVMRERETGGTPGLVGVLLVPGWDSFAFDRSCHPN